MRIHCIMASILGVLCIARASFNSVSGVHWYQRQRSSLNIHPYSVLLLFIDQLINLFIVFASLFGLSPMEHILILYIGAEFRDSMKRRLTYFNRCSENCWHSIHATASTPQNHEFGMGEWFACHVPFQIIMVLNICCLDSFEFTKHCLQDEEIMKFDHFK